MLMYIEGYTDRTGKHNRKKNLKSTHHIPQWDINQPSLMASSSHFESYSSRNRQEWLETILCIYLLRKNFPYINNIVIRVSYQTQPK